MGLGAGVAPVGVVFLSVLVVTGWSVLSLVLTPLFLASLVLVPEVSRVVKPAYRRVAHFVQWAWMANVAFLLEFVFGMSVTFTGDAATKAKESKLLGGERALWIPNHRTRIDWMLLWTLAVRTQTLGQMKIVLKAPLRVTPIFGWATQHFLFIFLNRHWEDDERMLNSYLPFLVANEPQSSYMLFPEGTDLADTNLVKSAAFAAKNKLPERKFTLYPRTTGFKFMFPRIRDQLDAVYDITMFFVDHAPNERPSEAALLSGRTPRNIHFHIERVDIRDMPTKENDLGAWVEKSFERKEKNLKAYYEKNGRLPEGAQPLTFGDPMASYSLVVVFWLWFLTLATKMAWFWGWWSIYFAGVVAVGYAIITFAFGGVDSVLRKIL